MSEFDFIFVCLVKDSPHFGSARIIVNNCWEDEPFLESFEEFFEKIEKFADERIKQRVGVSEEEFEDMEPVEFRDFVKSDQ